MKNLIFFLYSVFLGGIVMAQNFSNDFVLVPSGSFMMGSAVTEDWRENDEMQHEVYIDSFYIGQTEVMQEEYERVMKKNPSEFRGKNLPVENVSFLDAVEYCNEKSKLENLTPCYSINGQKVTWNKNANGYRLPTEAEWEYACRAGTKTPFNLEKSLDDDDANFYGHYPYQIEQNYFDSSKLEAQPGTYRGHTVSVKSFKPNKWGIYDMHGNVAEWCFDNYAKYSVVESKNPVCDNGSSTRIVRGGGWNDFAKHMRSAYRSSIPQDDIFSSRGFRIAKNK